MISVIYFKRLIKLFIWSQISVQEFKGRVGGVKVKPVDTTGAGDAFVSGILYSIASDQTILKVIFQSSLILKLY